MDPECPAYKAMDFYCEETDSERRSERKTKKKEPTFPIAKLTTKEDLQQVHKLAEDRMLAKYCQTHAPHH